MAPKLTADERERIAAALRAGKPRNQVAREFGRGEGTVGRIAKAEGIDLARAETKTATEARAADVRARLAELAVLLTEDAHRLHGQLFAPHVAFAFGGRDNVYTEHEIPEPTARDKQALMTSIGIAIQRAAEIVHGQAPGVEEAKGLVRELLDGVSEWANSE